MQQPSLGSPARSKKQLRQDAAKPEAIRFLSLLRNFQQKWGMATQDDGWRIIIFIGGLRVSGSLIEHRASFTQLFKDDLLTFWFSTFGLLLVEDPKGDHLLFLGPLGD